MVGTAIRRTPNKLLSMERGKVTIVPNMLPTLKAASLPSPNALKVTINKKLMNKEAIPIENTNKYKAIYVEIWALNAFHELFKVGDL